MKWVLLTAAGVLFSATVFAERVLFIGDSITGQAENNGAGYARQMRTALSDAGVSNIEIVCLGGSGQTVGSWQSVITTSQTTDTTLDVAGVYVKTELDKGADTVIVCLGMNDALSPSTDFATVAAFEARYQTLVDMIKARTTFTRLLLAQPTMLTENPESYKNRLMRELCAAVGRVAQANSLTLIRTHEDFRNIWAVGRMDSSAVPGLSMTGDYVHPNDRGHFAMALSFLRAIGQTAAADAYYAKRAVSVLGTAAAGTPGFLFYAVPGKTPGQFVVGGEANRTIQAVTSETNGLQPTFSGTNFTATFAMPASGCRAAFTIPLTVNVGGTVCTKQIPVNPPWMVYTNVPPPNHGFYNGSLDVWYPDQMATSQDAALLAGQSATNVFSDGFLYYPTADFVGAATVGSIDFASLMNGNTFDMGYAVQYVYAPRAGNLSLALGVNAFAKKIYTEAFLNTNRVYSGELQKTSNAASVPVVLAKGWNTLVLKVSHMSWQFQGSASFQQIDATLAPSELIFAAVPYAVAESAPVTSGTGSGKFRAVGGIVEGVGDCLVHTFRSSGTFSVTGAVGEVEVLIVAGGGGGGTLTHGGGGGGGGGIVYTNKYSIGPGTYTVTVGNGGAVTANGGNSQFGELVAYGGGAGGNMNTAGSVGGSGGGGGGRVNSGSVAVAGGAGISGQGFGGGSGAYASAAYIGLGGGGGGAGGVGVSAVFGANWCATGGIGRVFNQFNTLSTNEWYGGGGGGGTQNSGITRAPGGLGGGGYGGVWGTAATSAATNSGGGGGGGGQNTSAGGSGGSGIVKVKYRIVPAAYTKGEGGTAVHLDGYRVHTFSQSGAFVAKDYGMVEVLVVGGGGGGGSGMGGGGGAGGVVYTNRFLVVPGTNWVTVGTGGGPETNGLYSSIGGLIAYGGGAGGNINATGKSGGNGGGGGGGNSAAGAGGAPLTVYGFGGGSGTLGSTATGWVAVGGGGGGATAAGNAGVWNDSASPKGQCGKGGDGVAFDISGELKYYGGGGSGGGRMGTLLQDGGLGGGGKSGGWIYNPPTYDLAGDGIPGTGGGGGGGGMGTYYPAPDANKGNPGGYGGSGIVILRYQEQPEGTIIRLK